MAAYSQAATKRQKTVRETVRTHDPNEFFPGIPRAEYKPEATAGELNFRHYNPIERVHGRTMEDWIRVTVPLSHAYCSGSKSSETLSNAEAYKKRMRSCFEFYTKLGIKLYCAWDCDLLPDYAEQVEDQNDGSTANIKGAPGDLVDLVSELQLRAGARPLWIGADLQNSSRYSNGAGSNPDAAILTLAAAQTKRALELAQKLNSECYMTSSIQEGYQTIVNTDITKELRNQSKLLKMIAEYKDRLGYRGQLLLQTGEDQMKTLSNTREFGIQLENGQRRSVPLHKYNYDAMSALCFLKHFNLDRSYKLSVTPGHQLYLSSAYGLTGSVDFGVITSAPDIRDATVLMRHVIEQGGLGPGGICIALGSSADARENFSVYMNVIETLAKGLKIAAKSITDQLISKSIHQRYVSYQSGFGSRLASGEVGLDDCEEQWRAEGRVHEKGGESRDLFQENRDLYSRDGGQWDALIARYTDVGSVK